MTDLPKRELGRTGDDAWLWCDGIARPPTSTLGTDGYPVAA